MCRWVRNSTVRGPVAFPRVLPHVGLPVVITFRCVYNCLVYHGSGMKLCSMFVALCGRAVIRLERCWLG